MLPRFCLPTGYLTVTSVPHSLSNTFKQVLALFVETEYIFPLAKMLETFVTYTSAFWGCYPMAIATTAAPTVVAAKLRLKPRKTEESDEDMGFGLFDQSP